MSRLTIEAQVETLRLIALLGHPDAEEQHPWLKGDQLRGETSEAAYLQLIISKANDAFNY